MRFKKRMVLIALGVLLVSGNLPAGAGQPVPPKEVKETQATAPKKAREGVASAPRNVQPVRRGTEFVKKIEGGFLYTEKGRYSLSGVKVIDLSKNRKDADRTGDTRKKTAEMTFLNHQLHEVVIRQR